ncbi:MAG: SCO family protein [Leptospiraceae bacterium]|nr:SCO family protein [Leptospiraceae bacterium]
MKLALPLLLVLQTWAVFAYDPSQREVKNSIPPEIEGLKVENRLGQKINLDREFLNEDGNKVSLRSLFESGKPILLSLVYYRCPTLCNFHLTGLNNIFKGFDWNLGDKFEYVAISIDPEETPALAKAKKKAFTDDYSKSAKGRSAAGWHFLTDNSGTVKDLATELGFPYRYNEGLKQWNHPSVVYILTPTGTISRYLQGIQFSETDLKLSIMEASGGKIGGVLDKFIMYCYQFDPNRNRYAIYAMNIMRIGAVFTVFLIGSFLLRFWMKNSRIAGEAI